MALAIEKNRTASLIICALFSALIAIGAFIKVPVPAVPFTLQFLFTTLAGILLGPRLGSLSVAVYLAVGLAGIPVFAQGGGPGYILQPSFGYLIGFYLGTYITGTIARTAGAQPTVKRLLIAGFAGLAVVYLIGMVYYYVVANYYIQKPIGVWPLIWYCFILALPGDVAICFVSAILGKRLIPILNRGAR